MAAGVSRKNAPALISQNYICALPTDVTTQFFIRVHPRDLLSCNRVCKHWYQIFQPASTWQHLLTRHFSSIKTPEKAEECQAAYKAEYLRRESNFKEGLFCLKPYVSIDGDEVSRKPDEDAHTIIWNSAIGKVKAVYKEQPPDPVFEIYDLTDKLVQAFKIKNMTLFLISGSYLFACSHIDGTLQICNIKTGEAKKSIRVSIPTGNKPAGAFCMTMDPSAIDQPILFLGCHDGSIKAYDIKEEKFLNFKPEVKHSQGVYDLLIRDRKLISASAYGGMLIWRLDDRGKPLKGEPAKEIDGHKGLLQILGYAYGDIFTVSRAGEIKRWDIETGHCMTTFKAQPNGPKKKFLHRLHQSSTLFERQGHQHDHGFSILRPGNRRRNRPIDFSVRERPFKK